LHFFQQQGVYSLVRAQQSFRSLVQIHEKNGEFAAARAMLFEEKKHTKKAIPFSLALRLRRICSTDTTTTNNNNNNNIYFYRANSTIQFSNALNNKYITRYVQ